MKYLFALLVLSLLVFGCQNNGDPELYEKTLAEREAYKLALEEPVSKIPGLREQTATLAKTHRELLAAQGQKMSPEEHKRMVQEQATKLEAPPSPKPPSEVDVSRMNELQQSTLEKITTECQMIATQWPLLAQVTLEHQWLEADVTRLQQVKAVK